MENLQRKISSSGHTLASAPFMRLSQPPPESTHVKGRAFEDLGSTFGRSHSQKSKSAKSTKSNGRGAPKKGKERVSSGDDDSPDEMDLFSSSNRGSDDETSERREPLVGEGEDVPEYLRQPKLTNLRFKKKTSGDSSATPKASQGTKTSSASNSQKSAAAPFNPTSQSPNNAGPSTSTKGSGSSPDENQPKAKEERIVGGPPLGMTRARSVAAKDVLGTHTANRPNSRSSRRNSPGPHEQPSPPSQGKGKGSRPMPTPAYSGVKGSAARSEPESAEDSTAGRARTRKARTVTAPSQASREAESKGNRPKPKAAFGAAKRQVQSSSESDTDDADDSDYTTDMKRKVKAKGKGKGKVTQKAKSCPIDGMSPPRSSQKKEKRRPAEFPMKGMSPPSKCKGKEKQTSGFPTLSPLANAVTSSQGSFPHLSPLSSPVHAASDPPWMEDIEDDFSSNARRLEPFPMATQDLAVIDKENDLLLTPRPRATKRSSGGTDSEGSAKKRRRAVPENDSVDFLIADQVDASQVDIDNLFLDPSVDPKTLCPWCDGPLPANPTPHLASIISAVRRKSYKQPRPTNPLGLKAPLSIFSSVCQRHRFETHQIPLARAKGWPTSIDFSALRGRVEKLRSRLQEIIQDGRTDLYEIDLDNMDEEEIHALGPRWRSVFWVDIAREVREKGSRVVGSLKNQFGSFEKTQPGYYGELGSFIIQQTLYNMFPPATFDAELIAPLNPTEFIQRVLVPEVGIALIMEDMNLDVGEAVQTLRESVQYGVAMYPGDAEQAGVGEEIVMERAAARRRELEEEESAEEDIFGDTNATEDMDGTNSDASRHKGKAKRHLSNLTIEGSTSTNVRRGTRHKNPVDYTESDEGGTTTDSDNRKTSQPRAKKRSQPPASQASRRTDTEGASATGASGSRGIDKWSSQSRPKPRPRAAAPPDPDSVIEIDPVTPRVTKSYASNLDTDSDDFTPQPPRKISRPPNSSSQPSGRGSSKVKSPRKESGSHDQTPWKPNMRAPLSEDSHASDATNSGSRPATGGPTHSWLLSDDSD